MGRLSFSLLLVALACEPAGPPERAAAPSASAVTEAAPPPAPPAKPSPPRSALELARGGDLDAIKQLDRKPAAERTIDECVAISEGHGVLARRSVEQLGRDLSADPALVTDPTTLALLFRHASDPLDAPAALAIVAGLPGSVGPDLLYEVYKHAGHAPTQSLAQDLLSVGSVRDRADEPLDLLLKLEAETRCEKLRTLIAELRDKGDRRAAPRLRQLAKKSGCGKKQTEDCYACLRDDGLLRATYESVKQRKPPRPWALARR
jgi:hypothetical protein